MATVPPPSASNPSPPLRIIFMGTPALAAHILERLIRDGSENASVVGVVTRPDSAQGRGLTMRQSEVAAVTEQHGVPTLKPTKIRTSEFAQELASMRPDLLVVAAYGRILPKSILDVPRIMPINVHASLLPRHRGASPVEAAILAGDSVTGVTIMRVTEGMDAGPMLLKAEVPIAADETTGTLKTKLAEAGATALLEALAKIRAGTIHEQPQDDSQATFTKPITKQDAKIDWSVEAVAIERSIRAFDPAPVAWTTLDGTELRIFKAAVDGENLNSAPGTVVAVDPMPMVTCGKGALRLIEVQLAGRKRMSAADFARGRRLRPGQPLGT